MTRRLGTGELEAQVMNILWDAPDPMTPAEVGALLPADHPLAYNTVMTILVRLYEKGALHRERHGRAWAYRPVESRDEHVANRMAQLLRESQDSPAALARFVEKMDRRERAALQRLLRPRRST